MHIGFIEMLCIAGFIIGAAMMKSGGQEMGCNSHHRKCCDIFHTCSHTDIRTVIRKLILNTVLLARTSSMDTFQLAINIFSIY